MKFSEYSTHHSLHCAVASLTILYSAGQKSIIQCNVATYLQHWFTLQNTLFVCGETSTISHHVVPSRLFSSENTCAGACERAGQGTRQIWVGGWANTRKDTQQMRSWERGALIHRNALKKLFQAPDICVAEAIYVGHYINGKILNWFSEKNTLYFLVEMLSPHTAVEKAFPSFKLAMKIFTKVDIWNHLHKFNEEISIYM